MPNNALSGVLQGDLLLNFGTVKDAFTVVFLGILTSLKMPILVPGTC